MTASAKTGAVILKEGVIMNCVNCNREINDNYEYCPFCGAKQPERPVQAAQPEQQPAQAEQQSAQTEQQSAQTEQTAAGTEGGSHAGESASQSAGFGTDSREYRMPPEYQSAFDAPEEDEKELNWVPYLVLSILTTVCCCIPTGIVAIVYAARINNAVNLENYAEAQRLARTGRIWIIVSVVAGILKWTLFFLVYIGIMGMGAYYYF